MRMFDQSNRFFRVGNTISPSANMQPDDVLKTKSALVQTGDYNVPDFGITEIPDMGMIKGLKTFQQKNGLKVDGVMKPNGPTEAKLGEAMVKQDIPTAPHVSKRNINLGYFTKLLKKAAKLYDIIFRLEDASEAYWQYHRALKAVNQTRDKWLILDKSAQALRTKITDAKAKYQENCGE